MRNEQYEKTVLIDREVVDRIARYKLDADPNLLVEVFDFLLPITSQEVWKVVSKLRLNPDLVEDMKQDSFIKLKEAVGNFDPGTCPVFVSFWRLSLYRHLISAYYTKARVCEEVNDLVVDTTPCGGVDRIFIEELACKYHEEFNDWTPNYQARVVPMLKAILKHRILSSDEDEIYCSQTTLASSFEVTQGYVAKWEEYFLNRMRDEYGEFYETRVATA